MNAPTLPRNLPAVLKCGTFWLIGWLCLWLVVGVIMCFASGSYEGVGFIQSFGYYGLGGCACFSLLGVLHHRHRAFSWWRAVLAGLAAGILAALFVPDHFWDWREDVRVWAVAVIFACNALFGLCLKWLSGLFQSLQ
jgi:hypothetical protein